MKICNLFRLIRYRIRNGWKYEKDLEKKRNAIKALTKTENISTEGIPKYMKDLFVADPGKSFKENLQALNDYYNKKAKKVWKQTKRK